MEKVRILFWGLLVIGGFQFAKAGDDGQSGIAKVPTLLGGTDWKTDTIDDGLIYHTFSAYDADASKAHQIVNVIELDLTKDKYELSLSVNLRGHKCSDAVRPDKAVAAVNGGYEAEAIYLKVDDYKASEVTLPSDHLRFWKHEGAIYWNSLSDLGLVFAGKEGADAIATYKADKHRNLLANAPMLIDDYVPVGLTFVNPALAPDMLKKLNYEDPRRHQGVRHPRTAVALTSDRDLLLITVDGRWAGRAEGMTARELTAFIVKYFNPAYALNLDGGGSTTMVLKGYGDPTTHVVNYPTDNGVFDHTGERSVNSHLVILRK